MKTRRALILITLVTILHSVAFAGAIGVKCTEPFVFSGADVNVVVIPYRSAGGDRALELSGVQLSLLIKLDVLSHILPYSSVGAIQAVPPQNANSSDVCDVNNIVSQLLGQKYGATAQVAPGKGLIVVWGILYEEGPQIVVQTYARYLRRDTPDSVQMRVGAFTFAGQPSGDTITFQAQRFDRAMLNDIATSFKAAEIIHETADDASPGKPLPSGAAKCVGCYEENFAYQVLEHKGEWIKIHWRETTTGREQVGWLHSKIGLASTQLDDLLPELHFIQGTVGYLRARIASGSGTQLSQSLRSLSSDEYSRFVHKNEEAGPERASALALQLSAIPLLDSKSPNDLKEAHSRLQKAAMLIPYDGDAISLASISELGLKWSGEEKIDAKMLASRFSAAAAISSDAKLPLQNLVNYYSLLLESGDSSKAGDLSKADLNNRLTAVGKIQAKY
jgi:hypothetical protein